MRRIFLTAAVAVVFSACSSTPSPAAPSVTATDLMSVVGDDWNGMLTYRDYSPPHGDVTLQVEARVRAVPEGLVISLHYPREPQADGVSELLLTENGRVFDGEPVTSRERTGDTLQIVTEAACQDDERPATCRHIYTFAPKQLGWRKLVRFAEAGEDIRRNDYSFTR